MPDEADSMPPSADILCHERVGLPGEATSGTRRSFDSRDACESTGRLSAGRMSATRIRAPTGRYLRVLHTDL